MNRVKVLKQREHSLYCAGMHQGKEDALNNTPSRLAKLWHSDTALLRGYADSYYGWKLALRNALKKAVKSGCAEFIT